MTLERAPLTPRQGLAYGLLGLPLAFVALPLYVLLPNHYARAYGMPLATLGAVLLAARLFDAATDPLLGRLSDRLFGRSTRTVLGAGAGSAVVLALGMWALFFPPVQGQQALAWWALLCLLATYLAYRQLSIAHQSWGARLGGDEALRSRIVAWRVGVGGQGAGFGDAELGVVAGAPDAHRQVGQHDGEEAPGAVEAFGEARCAEHAAAQKLEAARRHGVGEEAEALVAKLGDDPVVERGVAVEGHAAGGVGRVDVEPGQQRGGVEGMALQPRHHAGHETHRNGGAGARAGQGRLRW